MRRPRTVFRVTASSTTVVEGDTFFNFAILTKYVHVEVKIFQNTVQLLLIVALLRLQLLLLNYVFLITATILTVPFYDRPLLCPPV